MLLSKDPSKKTISKNIKKKMKRDKLQKQSVEITLNEADKPKKKKTKKMKCGGMVEKKKHK